MGQRAKRLTGEPIKVMIVDDDPAVRQALRLLLQREGDMVVVEEAANGVQAIARAADAAPEVVLMDVQMPGLDGIETARRLTAGHAGARVVLLTVYLDRVPEALDAGAAACLCKACPRTQLLGSIRQAAAMARAAESPGVGRWPGLREAACGDEAAT